VFVRKDLSFEQIVVQTGHALVESTKHTPYQSDHPSVIVLSAKNEHSLEKAIDFLKKNDIVYYGFREPDIGNTLTAVATAPINEDKRSLFRKYQLLRM
jgi:Peptidyl-tRNA hydrolase PTH2